MVEQSDPISDWVEVDEGMRQHYVIPLELQVIQREFSIVTGLPCYILGHQEMH